MAEQTLQFLVPLVIYGVPFYNVTMDETIEWIVDRIRSGRSANVVTANLDFVTQAWSDPELQRILIDADLVLVDGFPIVKLSPFFGPSLKQRVAGSDLAVALAERAAEEGLSLYGLGGGDGVAEQALGILQQRHPKLKVAGTYAPPFASLLELNHRDILQRLEKARPDILYVAFGAPKQDKFISMHVRGWNIPVAIGVGGSLDFVAGEQRRAPRWVQRIHLEWFWRLCHDPKRLLKRYLGNIRFLLSASRQLWQLHRMPDRQPAHTPRTAGDLEKFSALGVVVEQLQPLGSEIDAQRFITRMTSATAGSSILLDIHAMPWLDSLELGALLEVSKWCRSHGTRLILFSPRPKVGRLLATCRLDAYLDVAARTSEVESLLKRLKTDQEGQAVISGGRLKLDLPLELTASTLPSFELQTGLLEHELKDKQLMSLEVDAARLDFIDSSGLGYLIALKKNTQDKGISMSIANMPSKPRKIFEVARVDKVLLQN